LQQQQQDPRWQQRQDGAAATVEPKQSWLAFFERLCAVRETFAALKGAANSTSRMPFWMAATA
jgi:hypothetical protein